MQIMQATSATAPPATSEAIGSIESLRERIAADPDARFAISLDRLAYAKDSYQLGLDLVRIYARTAPVGELPAPAAENVRTLLGGLRILTGRAHILGVRYGALAVQVRDDGGSLFDFESDELARDVVVSIAAADPDLARKVRERGGRAAGE